MPRSSRSKSHKQKVKEYSDSEEDVKMKERNGKEKEKEKEEISVSVSARVSKDLSSGGEKRKFSSSSQSNRDGKDLYGHGNGDLVDENVVSKRRKERENAGGDERSEGLVNEKEVKGESLKSKEVKVSVESKSKSSRRHESASEKKEDVEKEETKGVSSRVDSKRKSEKEKDSGRRESRGEVKEKERSGTDKEKLKDGKDVDVARKQGSHGVDLVEERQSKRGKENAGKEWPLQDELQNPEHEKELEKRARRRGDGSGDKDKYQEDVRHSDDKRSSRGDRSKDVRHKDEKNKDERHKVERHADKYPEEGEKDNRYREEKYRESGEKDGRYWDGKVREDGEKDTRRRDDKHRGDTDRDNRHDGNRDKYREDGDRDKYREDGDRDKYREDGDRDKYREDGNRDKYREDGDRDTRYREDKYFEHGKKDDRYHRDDKYREDDKDVRHKEDKHREDVDRDGKARDVKQKNDSERDRDKRARDVKYRDEHTSRDRSNESDMKRPRDEINVVDHNYRKSSNRDTSPVYDDRVTRYKEDKGRRRVNDNEGHSDVRSRSAKEPYSDAEKRPINSSKVDLVTDRGRSNSRNMDGDVTLSHSRRRSPPSSSTHATRDHYRVSKPEESKYRDYGYDERSRHNLSSSREFTGTGLTEKISSSRLVEKSMQKDDNQIGEVSADRRPRLDSRGSPLRMVNKSPSSSGIDRRHLSRSDVRRGLDVEESGQRGGGSRDYNAREGKGSREFPIETHPVDEPPQVDGDNLSVSSPFNRNNTYAGNSRSHLPPPSRTVVDSTSAFGMIEDDNRGRSNNRHRRGGDANMGRPQGNTWKGSVPNWPSPVANGFMPFQHGPPPVGFHPVMPQFPAPQLFGVRPPMDMNHTLPYHMPDTDRFSAHGRPLSWRNPADEHGWDANNAVFGEEAHMYGRLDWDQNRSQMSNRGWDTSGDMWKGKNIGLSGDVASAPQKEELARMKADEILSGQSVQQPHIEQNQPSLQADNLDAQSSDGLDNISEATKHTSEENHETSMVSVKDDIFPYSVYLSKLDISTDLIQPELYEQFASLMDMDNKMTIAVEDNTRIIYFEEVFEAKSADKISSGSLFSAVNDSVFQKAMSLYNKQREQIGLINSERVVPSNLADLEAVQTFDSEEAASNVDKPGGLASSSNAHKAESTVKDYEVDVDMSGGLRELEEKCPTTGCQKLDEPGLKDTFAEHQVSLLNIAEMEVDLAPEQEDVLHMIVDDKVSSMEDVQQSDTLPPGNPEEMQQPNNREVCLSANNEGMNLIENKCDPLHLSDVPSEACEAVMPGWIESGSVNLSRIHHSPESTH